MAVMNKDKYQDYLKSAHWKSTRAIKMYNAGNKCENCGSIRRLQVHHKNYDNLYNEIDNDLKVLCEFCHKEIEHAETGKSYNKLVASLAEAKRFKK